MHFAPKGAKLRCCRHRAGGKQGSTGALHLGSSNPSSPKAEKRHTERCVFFLASLAEMNLRSNAKEDFEI